MNRHKCRRPPGWRSVGEAAGRRDGLHEINVPDHQKSIAELVTTPVFRVALPTGEQYLTQDVELIERPVYRVVMPNGEPTLMEPPGDCSHCTPQVNQIGRRRNSALVLWLCSGGCGYHPISGTPLDREQS